MRPFTVWCPDDGDMPEATNTKALDAEDAACVWVENNWPNLDHADSVDVKVSTEEGDVYSFTVEAESTVTFRVVGT